MPVHKTPDHKEDYRTNRADYLIAKLALRKKESKPGESLPDERRPARDKLSQPLARPRPHR